MLPRVCRWRPASPQRSLAFATRKLSGAISPSMNFQSILPASYN
jgi:hypothetical protein